MTKLHPVRQFINRVASNPSAPYLHQAKSGQWQTYTWAEVDTQARKIASALQDQGYAPGDRIAILAKNSMEWIVSDIAIAMAGYISVPIYATAGESTINYVLNHSGSKAVFVGKLDDPKEILAGVPEGLADRLAQGKVYVSVRGRDAVRVTPHLWVTDEDEERFFTVLTSALTQ